MAPHDNEKRVILRTSRGITLIVCKSNNLFLRAVPLRDQPEAAGDNGRLA